jgi:hypothetical protein
LFNTVGNAISQNKDTIGAVASSVGSVADFAKSIADNVKVSNELKKVKHPEGACLRPFRKKEAPAVAVLEKVRNL